MSSGGCRCSDAVQPAVLRAAGRGGRGGAGLRAPVAVRRALRRVRARAHAGVAAVPVQPHLRAAAPALHVPRPQAPRPQRQRDPSHTHRHILPGQPTIPQHQQKHSHIHS